MILACSPMREAIAESALESFESASPDDLELPLHGGAQH
jgi:hypothetical protein